MAKKNRSNTRRNENTNGWVQVFSIAVDLGGRVIDRFGWAGAVLLGIYFFVVQYASLEQKQEIVGVFVLGKGISEYYLLGVIVGMWVLTFVAQDRIWRRNAKLKDDEITRLSEWKSEHQRKLIGDNLLHHTPKRGEQ